jgi:pilus assembly protein FimV
VLSFAPGGDGAAAGAKTKSPNAMSFNMDSLSLDLTPNPSPQTQSISEQLETSMELAKQFIEIGELKGARSMLDEVIANGSNEQRHRAQAMLAKLK